MITAVPPGPGPELLVDVGSVPMDAADSLGKAGQGVDQRSATSVLPVWLRGICGLAIDGGTFLRLPLVRECLQIFDFFLTNAP